MPRILLLLAAIACFAPSVFAQPGYPKSGPAKAGPGEGIHTLGVIYAPAAVIVALDDRLPITKLKPSKLIPNLCLYKYRVTTASAECQAFIDQSLGFYYSYVYPEAARSAETAIRIDPDCAYA